MCNELYLYTNHLYQSQFVYTVYIVLLGSAPAYVHAFSLCVVHVSECKVIVSLSSRIPLSSHTCVTVYIYM